MCPINTLLFQKLSCLLILILTVPQQISALWGRQYQPPDLLSSPTHMIFLSLCFLVNNLSVCSLNFESCSLLTETLKKPPGQSSTSTQADVFSVLISSPSVTPRPPGMTIAVDLGNTLRSALIRGITSSVRT